MFMLSVSERAQGVCWSVSKVMELAINFVPFTSEGSRGAAGVLPFSYHNWL
jgi:hypothetical protein